MPPLGWRPWRARASRWWTRPSRQLGIHESPWGSNCGGSEKYQALYAYLGKCGWPWCGAFVGWCWEQIEAGAEVRRDPSTATMCSSKPNVSAQPGAAFVICRHPYRHPALLPRRGHLGLHRRQPRRPGRLLDPEPLGDAGGRPALAGRGRRAAEPPEKTWYFLQDVGRGRATPASASTTAAGAPRPRATSPTPASRRTLGHELRKFKDPDFERLLPDRQQRLRAPRSTAAGRARPRATRPARRSRTASAATCGPFSETRTKAQGGVPWNCATWTIRLHERARRGHPAQVARGARGGRSACASAAPGPGWAWTRRGERGPAPPGGWKPILDDEGNVIPDPPPGEPTDVPADSRPATGQGVRASRSARRRRPVDAGCCRPAAVAALAAVDRPRWSRARRCGQRVASAGDAAAAVGVADGGGAPADADRPMSVAGDAGAGLRRRRADR